jgi:multidrug efflux system membrane fusion protein
MRPASRDSSRRFTSPKAPLVRRGDVLFEIDPRPFQAEVDRLQASWRAPGRPARAPSRKRSRAAALGREGHLRRGNDRRSSSAVEADAQVSAVEAALRAPNSI